MQFSRNLESPRLDSEFSHSSLPKANFRGTIAENARIVGKNIDSILIKDTTREQREQIVADSLGNISAYCDGCMAGLAEMYQDYIDGKKELREINMEFNARYVSGREGPGRSGCGMR